MLPVEHTDEGEVGGVGPQRRYALASGEHNRKTSA